MNACLCQTVFVLASLAPAVVAQDVATVLKGTTLSIKGSAGIDDLTVSSARTIADGSVDVLVTPNNGTTLNGSTDPITFPAVQKLKANLGPGADVIGLTDFDFGDNPITLNGGPGDDQVNLTSCTSGDFKFVGSSGNDTFDLESSHLGKTKVSGASGVLTMPATSTYFEEMTLKSGPEIDVLNWNDVTVDFRLKLNTGGGNDLITLTAGTVGTQSTLKFGGGNDHFTDDGGLYGEFVAVVAGGGDDEIVFEDSLIGNALNVKLGAGINELTLLAQDDDVIVGNSATITGGKQSDTVTLQVFLPPNFVQIGNDLVVSLKAGVNELELTGDVGVGNDLLYTGGGLDDLVDAEGTDVGNDATISLSGGNNAAVLTDCGIGNDLRVTAGNGDDICQLPGTTVGGLTLISLGGGDDQRP